MPPRGGLNQPYSTAVWELVITVVLKATGTPVQGQPPTPPHQLNAWKDPENDWFRPPWHNAGCRLDARLNSMIPGTTKTRV